MYLIMILILVILVPFILMPKDIASGRKTPYESVVKSVMVVALCTALAFMLTGMMGEGIYSQLHGIVTDVAKTAATDPNLVSLLGLEESSEAEVTALLVQIYDMGLKQLPACILIMAAVAAYFIYMILSRSLAKRGQPRPMPPYREFTLPRAAVFALIAAYMIVWLLTMTEVFSDDSFYMNINLLFDFAFYVQGMSVVFMLFYAKRIPKGFAAALAVLLWFISVGRMIIVMLGMFDMIFVFKEKILRNGSSR